jgi:D-aminopeptidase
MKKLVLGTLVALAAGMLTVPSAFATGDGQQKMTKEEWKKLTPEQKAEKKAAAKAKYDAMTPEQQAAAKKHFAEKHPQAAAEMAKKQEAASAAAK